MGALWGAVAGGAKAAKEHFVRKEEAEIAEAKSASDEARATRLEKMRQKYRTQENEADREFRTEERVGGEGFKAKESAAAREETGKQKEYDRQQRAVEASEDRRSAKEIAGIKAEATKAGGSGSSKGGDYQSVKIKSSVMTDDGFEEKEVPIVFQKSTGQYFEDRGGKLVPYKLEEQLEGPQAALYKYASSYPKEALAGYLKTEEGKRLGIPGWYELTYGKQP